MNGYSNDFEKLALCKEVALNQIAGGSVVIFQVAGGCGLGALDAAKEKNVWGVGVDADQGYLGNYVLTSALKRVDTSVYDAIKDAKDGSFKGGTDAVYGLDVNGVGIGKFSPKAPAGIAAKVQQIKQQIVAGKIKNIPTIVK
jgi:basic membrane protein A